MYTVNFSVGIFVVYLITRVQSQNKDNYVDDAPATNNLYGQNKCCHFAYAWSVKMSQMKEYCPNAELFAAARLPKHEIAFTENGDPDPTSFLATIVDDAQAELPGIAYLVPIDEYLEYVKTEVMSEEKRIQYLSTFNVEATRNGQTTTINCNAILSAGWPPQKPCKSDVETLVETFKEAKFPQAHIDRISATPSEPSC